MLMNLLFVFLGGGVGSMARYLMTFGIGRAIPSATFPWPTLSVNIVGAFIIGVLLEILALRMSLTAPLRFLLVTGFVGGFTTFSAFSLEAALLLEKGAYLNVAAYIGLSVIGTIAMVFLGSFIVRSLS